MNRQYVTAVCGILIAGSTSFGQEAATQPAPASAASPATTPAPETSAATAPAESALRKVLVYSLLDRQRNNIAPSLGAVTHVIGPDQIEAIPGGENATLQQVLLRAPGVVEDSFGQEHVRGEHANLTYRINGVLLPQPLNGFGQEVDTHLIQSLTLITGSLPAQFGFHTAGIVDIQTKTGSSLNGTALSLYGGSFSTVEPSFATGGTDQNLDYFFTGTFNHNGLGIENPTSSYDPLHDFTNQEKFFGYLAYKIDDTSRISLIMNESDADFQIPNSPGLKPGFNLEGTTAGNSADINENQNEQEYYSVLSYQKSAGDLSFQLSAFTRYAQIDFNPDIHNDLIFQGTAGHVFYNFETNGIQFDSSLIANDDHTVRAGFIVDDTDEKQNTSTFVFPVNPDGTQASNTPEDILDNTGNHAIESGMYLQDEWRMSPQLTFNYGLRYDRFDSNFDNEDQLSPRANLVWKIDSLTTAHAGYSRYFVTPPVQNVFPSTLAKFAGTTNAPPNFIDDAPKAERSNYFDFGVTRQVTKPWQLGIDAFYKQAHNLIDLGQFGAPVIESPFNYRAGTVYGAELSSTYTEGGLSLFGNFSFVRTAAHDIDTQQFLIDDAELAFIQNHDIHLDHESEFTVSAGASYAWRNDRVYLDFLLGSGLRAGFANEQTEPVYYPLNAGYEHVIHLDSAGKSVLKLRLDVTNIFDQVYELRNGSGIGVGAPQYGARRGFFGGITYEF